MAATMLKISTHRSRRKPKRKAVMVSSLTGGRLGWRAKVGK